MKGVDTMKIAIDPGHGGKDPGAVGAYSKEKDINLALCLKLKQRLKASGIDVIMTRETDVYLDLQPRCDIANKNKADYFLSVHCNSVKDRNARGTETFSYARGTSAYKLAEILQETMVRVSGSMDRGVKTARFYVLRETKMPAVLVETLFISNEAEEKKLNDKVWQDRLCDEMSKALCIHFGVRPVTVEKTPIVGKSIATAEQMDAFVRKVNPEAPNLADAYLKIGEMEGIRGDLAFAQAILETGYFRFGNDVQKEQNNFAGIGATGNKAKGAFFATPEEGILAQIQHLKAYANTEPLKTEKVDPRFELVSRGSAPYWEELNGKWAVPGDGYGEKIIKIWKGILKTEVVVPRRHYAQDLFDEWKATGLVEQDHDLDTPITWGEYLITQYRLKNMEKENEK